VGRISGGKIVGGGGERGDAAPDGGAGAGGRGRGWGDVEGDERNDLKVVQVMGIRFFLSRCVAHIKRTNSCDLGFRV